MFISSFSKASCPVIQCQIRYICYFISIQPNQISGKKKKIKGMMSKRFLVTILQFIGKINLLQSDHIKWLKHLCLGLVGVFLRMLYKDVSPKFSRRNGVCNFPSTFVNISFKATVLSRDVSHYKQH